MHIDLNCDMGESFGAYTIGDDEAVMRSITSANVACGFHAGDPSVIRRTLRLAKAHGVAVGAHPGFADLGGFGRREIDATASEVEDAVLYQVSALAGMASAEGLTLQHVKPHGALYHMAARDAVLAGAIARAVAAFDRGLILFCLPGSPLLTAGREKGLPVVAEGFADRAYEADGSLVSRRTPGAVIHDAARVVDRVLRMVRDRTVEATDGSTVSLDTATICVHGDTPDAADLVAKLRVGLQAAGVTLARAGAA